MELSGRWGPSTIEGQIVSGGQAEEPVNFVYPSAKNGKVMGRTIGGATFTMMQETIEEPTNGRTGSDSGPVAREKTSPQADGAGDQVFNLVQYQMSFVVSAIPKAFLRQTMNVETPFDTQSTRTRYRNRVVLV